jgi:hypothetical protein
MSKRYKGINLVHMTYSIFQNLSNNEKADCLWDRGKPVGSYNRENARFILYQLDGFYVEAEYKTDFMELVRLKPFETCDLPDIYLGQVNISGLNH